MHGERVIIVHLRRPGRRADKRDQTDFLYQPL